MLTGRTGRRVSPAPGKRKQAAGYRTNRKDAGGAKGQAGLLRLVVCGSLFVLLVAVKLLLPGRMTELDRTLSAALNRNMDVKAVFAAVGELFTREGGAASAAEEVYRAVFQPEVGEADKTSADSTDTPLALTELKAHRLADMLPAGESGAGEVDTENLVLYSDEELPENVSFREAAMLEPLSVALHAVKRSGVKPGDTAAVIGTGMIGFAAAAWAKALGAETVFVIGRGEAKRAIAEQIPGISYVTEEESKAIQADVVVEAVGTPQAVSSAVLLARPGGSIVLMGNPSGDLAMEKNVYWRILRKQLNLMGTWNSSYEKDEACDWTEALDALSKKKIPAQALITHCFPSEKLMDGLELMKNHKEPYCKVMVSWE